MVVFVAEREAVVYEKAKSLCPSSGVIVPRIPTPRVIVKLSELRHNHDDDFKAVISIDTKCHYNLKV